MEDSQETGVAIETPAPVRIGCFPVFLVVIGVLCIFCAAWRDSIRLEAQSWASGVFVPDGAPELAGAVPVETRRIPPSNFSSLATWLLHEHPELEHDPSLREMVDAVRTQEQETEWILFAPLENEEMSSMLASGRLPEPGLPEVLAGPLVRVETFDMDGITFSVVGRLTGAAAPFLQACILPFHTRFLSQFSPERGATRGWIHPDGLAALEEKRATEAAAGTTSEALQQPSESSQEGPEVIPEESPAFGGIALADSANALGGIGGLVLVGCGGAWIFTRILRLMRQRGNRLVLPILEEIDARPRLWLALHILLYGSFVATMLLALRFPAWNLALSSFVADMFREGELSFIGDAYASNSIGRAAIATFYHNYVTATLILTLGVSLILPGIGLVKTLISFAFMGFAMSPMWSGLLHGYTYHSLTMVMEFEAYTLAAFAVAVYAIHVVPGVVRGALAERLAAGLRAVFASAIICGAVLALAALYEAVSLLTLQ